MNYVQLLISDIFSFFSPLSSTTTVFVKVDDVQDTPPVFYLLPYDRTIKENVEVVSLEVEELLSYKRRVYFMGCFTICKDWPLRFIHSCLTG